MTSLSEVFPDWMPPLLPCDADVFSPFPSAITRAAAAISAADEELLRGDPEGLDAAKLTRMYRVKCARLEEVREEIAALVASAHNIAVDWVGLRASAEAFLSKSEFRGALEDPVAKWTALESALAEMVRTTAEASTEATTKLKDERDTLDAATAAIRDMISTGAKELIQEPISEHLCPICYEAPIGACCVPCGHTMCQKCSVRERDATRCGICRTEVQNRIRLFFSV